MGNLYLPDDWTVGRIEEVIPDHFLLSLLPPRGVDVPEYLPGQFFQLSIHGIGEAPISVSSSPALRGSIEMCIRKVGRVTTAVASLERGDKVGIRGPYGNGYPMELLSGRDLLLLAGGLGMVPLRSLLNYAADRPDRFGTVTLLYGARTDDDLLFVDELGNLNGKIEVHLAVQEVLDREGKFGGRTGFVTDLIPGSVNDASKTVAAVCGPPVFYRYAIRDLLAEGFSKKHIFMSLERRMECGVGKCGHCSVGYRYTCVDGPIFNYWDAFNIPELVEIKEGEPWIS